MEEEIDQMQWKKLTTYNGSSSLPAAMEEVDQLLLWKKLISCNERRS